MKRKKLGAWLLTAALLLGMLPAPAMAADTFGDFKYSVNNNTVTITGYTGSGDDVVIPDEIEGNPVTAIGMDAFQNHSEIKSVVIPDGVTYIGVEAFADCSALKSVVIPNSVTTIGDAVFHGCTSLASIEIPNGVTGIGTSMFRNCSSLESITIPASVTSIGNSAFNSCFALTSVKILGSVTTIGHYAFNNCYNLAEINLPDGLTSIKEYAFIKCASLASITIPGSVTTIEPNAFSDCTSLTSLTISNGVPTIGQAFVGCTSLVSIEIPDSVTSIEARAFDGCTILNLAILPDGCQLGDHAIPGGATLIKYTVDSGGNVTVTSVTPGSAQLDAALLPDTIGGRPFTVPDCKHEVGFSYANHGNGRTHTKVCVLCKKVLNDSEPHSGNGTCNECGGKMAANVTITWETQEPLTYTGQPAAITSPTVTPENGREFDGKIRYFYKKDGGSDFTDGLPVAAGTYTLRAVVNDSLDYITAIEDTTLTIKQAEITVTADDQTAAVGEAAPAPTCTVTGLVNGESLKTQPTAAYETAPDMSTAGTTAIKASGAEAPDGGNYIITYVDGTLTVTPPSVVNYTVAFDSQGGSAVASQTVTAGGKAAKPGDPTRSGYNFGGWYRDSDCTTAWSFDTDTVTGDVTLYAKWTEPLPDICTVAFDSQGGSAVPSQTVTAGGKAAKPGDPTRSGYNFGGWYQESDCTTAWSFDADTVTGDITLYAKWTEPLPDTCTVAFDSRGGSAVPSQTITAGGKAAKPGDPTRSGYNFGGWYRDSDCATPWNFDADTVTGDVTLYAKWTAQSTGGGSGGGGGSYTPPTYPPAVEKPSAGGTVTVSPSRPGTGDKVTVRPQPDSGYEVDKVTVTDKNGRPVAVTKNPDGTYSFTQPSDTVKVEVSYKTTETKPADTPWSNPFRDVAENVWYSEAVRYVAENGLMEGYSSGQFGPNDNLTRAQLAQILHSKEGKPGVNYLLQFGDVAGGAWYTEAVRWAAAQGIVGGYEDGRFGPNDNITREQLAMMLWRYAGSPAAAEELRFSDAEQISRYALDAMRWAVENGIMSGYDNSQLGPRGLATRAQIAQMLMNFFENR